MNSDSTDVRELIVKLSDSLIQGVLPHVVDSHFAQLQVRAARELLLNLSERVEYKRDQASTIERSRSAAAATIVRLLQGVGDGKSTPDVPVPVCRALPVLIDVVYQDGWDDASRAEALEAVWAVVRLEFDIDAERVKTGMYK